MCKIVTMILALCLCAPAAYAYQAERASEADKPPMTAAEPVEGMDTTEPAEEPVEDEEEPSIEEQVRINRECGELAYDIPAGQCPGHAWEYDYDHDANGDMTYGRYCVNCGETEELDACPPELAWTLPDDGEGQEEPEEIPDEEVTEDEPETDPADESGADGSAEMEG